MQDLRFAFRQLLKNPGFTAVAVLTLAVGLALTAAALATVNAYLLRSLPYQTAHCVYHLMYAPPGPYEPRGMTAIDWKTLEDVYDVPLKQGREFTAADRLGSEPVAVLSETLARQLWPNSSAIGRQIRVVEGDMPGSPLGPWRTVVGVVGDIRQGYEDLELRDIYLPFLQVPIRFASVHVRTALPLSFWEESIRTAAAELERYAQVGTATTIVSEDRQRMGTRFLASMLTGFAVFAALLAVLGIYGVTSYAVKQREREIAVRLALGASKDAIVRMFLREGARVLGIGLGLGLLGAIATARILESQVYGVQPLDAMTRVTACVLIIAVGFSAIWWPARRAAMRSPMAILKEG